MRRSLWLSAFLSSLALTGCPIQKSGDSGPGTTDADGDGYGGAADCDNASAAIHPGAAEVCDGLDNDCSGVADDEASDSTAFYADADGDGFGDDAVVTWACELPAGSVASGGDCDDGDPAFHPGATESDCTDPSDYNCDGSSAYTDLDEDGWAACTECDDASASVNPDATESCNGTDDDCDGATDEAGAEGESNWYADADGDGYGDLGQPQSACDAPAGNVADATDCDDGEAAVHPGADENDCADPIDYNCDGSTGYADVDRDGWAACSECDDAAAAVNPGANESCNAVDDDCDGATDEAGASGETTWYADADGDGYGDPTDSTSACDAPAGYVADSADCDDTDDRINPATTWYRDADEDGYGGSAYSAVQCEAPAGYALGSTDCDDYDASVSPAGAEVCDDAGVDEDCDGLVDDADSSTDASTLETWYRDTDGDGYGGSTTVRLCAAPSAEYVASGGDCADADAAISPGAMELCDASDTDEDCDGAADTADSSAVGLTTWYADADADGYGDASESVVDCDTLSGYVTNASDCDDSSATANPGGTEACDGANSDEDCDGAADDLDSSATGKRTWYLDDDGDSYGLASATASACDLPSGYSASSGDCDDASAAISPADVEICDGSNTDEDCDGTADDADTSASAATMTTFYRDADGDGYGVSTTTARRCDLPNGFAASSTDCDDADAAISPAASEVCDAADTDEDCDSLADDADSSVGSSGRITLYADADRDGYGSPASASSRCDASSAWVTDYTDCDDTLSTVNPGVTNESCATSWDDDCDGSTNEVNATACVSYYVDADADGYGDGTGSCVCAATGSYTATLAGDCDETASTIHPGATERCDGVDQDCDGTVDDGMTLYYTDADLDGYGDDSETGSCTGTSGAVTVGLDCDDGNPAANPAEVEVCDAADVDEDCDGFADDDDVSVTNATSWYVDADLDGYGDENASAYAACDQPSSYTDEQTDCDDTDVDVNPGANEWYGDTVDEDCDGSTTPSRTYCTPNVGSGRTYSTISAAISGGVTSICLAAGTYSYSSSTDVPISGQGIGVSYYVGDVGDDATDLSITGHAYSGGGTLTRVDISSYVRATGAGSYSANWTVYDSIIRGGAYVSTTVGTSASGSASVTMYNTYLYGGTYPLYAYADGNYSYGITATAYISCYGCTIEAGSTGLYYLYANDRARTYLYLYNSVYESATTYTYEGYWSSYVYENTGYNSTSTSLLDYAYEPPRPTGALIDAGSTSYGRTTDFWGLTRSGNPDLGAVEY